MNCNNVMNDIKRKLRNLGTLIPDSNEATRNEYISAILHAAIHITRRETDKEISLLPQLQIMGFVQNVIQCESALQTNRKKHKAGVALGVTLKRGGYI
ncbi:hypothetical protein RhiirC2_802386 [Rhizophagus irregularis]|uniref:Uncharacterized protein n=1 Tax=Rhizophagus irregularis TaxID=588596 RepID=A0A2N1M0X3_9GLOM|nr:hypothetical protein RhiirC2_802992 [Rhizophagus irregularis]PKK55435.1 hypothetical protein RhiirC2_802386 [Rhizophagus irregularis]